MSGTSGNRIRELRHEAGLTQTALAEAAGLTQQRIQRMEAGVGPLRLEQVDRLARALDVTIYDLVPALAPPRPKKGRAAAVPENDDRRHLLEPESAPRHTLRVGLVGGQMLAEVFYDYDQERVRSILSDGDKQWLVLEGADHAMAIRIGAIEWARIEFDLAGETMSQAEYDRLKGTSTKAVYIREEDEGVENDAAENWLDAYFVSGRVERHEIEPDRESSDPDEGFPERGAEMQQLFMELDGDFVPMVNFPDSDGELVYLNVMHLAAVVSPVINCHPALYESVLEGGVEQADPA